LDAYVSLERDGRFGDAVVSAQTGMEVLLDGLLALMLWEEGVTPEDAAAGPFSDIGFEKRVRTHFHRRLGGNWSTTGRGVMSEWAREVARMRGRVVHSGYRPSANEARRALDITVRVDAFIRKRVMERRNVYPRTTLLLLGRPGLERAGVWRGRIKEFAERADLEPDWIASFAAWRTDLDRLRSV
jgi:hypothetical protein